MSTPSDALTDEDRQLLARPLLGFLTVAGGPDPAQPRPVWFEATEKDTIQLFTSPDTVKIRRLRTDPRASIIVATPVGEQERWVSITGRVTLHTDGANDLLQRLFTRYWGEATAERADELAGMMAQEWVRIVIHPERVRRVVN
ncbi:pyridoxamine 5'-phosphate oxidase family protein [Saccharopolyspora spinosa]|uniref:Pyridoxamine 5'-phosphate oxidase n=1 Tax=Saccharopolyspora spinosa TaxID=60894 RepID=A0A2N3Y3Z6_SACSN|nr:pyridoxamine 5'-phosphate oxidase family protein [Saccharopolyspora spinosa]PKW17642.1 pyridoxamine 5'-phosphate oxidase [Saccharopolyspora spinosa]